MSIYYLKPYGKRVKAGGSPKPGRLSAVLTTSRPYGVPCLTAWNVPSSTWEYLVQP